MEPVIEYDDETFQKTLSDLPAESPPPQLHLASSTGAPLVHTPRASIKLHSDAYITSSACISPSTYAVALSSSDETHSISYIDIAQSSLTVSRKLVGAHKDSITSIQSVPDFSGSSSPSILASSSKDGTIKLWDGRDREAAKPVAVVNMPKPHGILSFDTESQSYMLAAGSDLVGSDAIIRYCDLRNNKEWLHFHSLTHSDDITSIHFKPRKPSIEGSSSKDLVVLSASSDGLLSTSYASEADEEEAPLKVFNWKTSISRCGWYGEGKYVWSASDMETFATWDYELNERKAYGDLRCLSIEGLCQSDYIIDCTDFGDQYRNMVSSHTEPGLGIWMGANSGDFSLMTPTDSENWRLERLFKGGHNAIVRTIVYNQQAELVLTGGEDSLVNVWSLSSNEGGGMLTIASDMTMDEDEVMDDVSTDKSPKAKRTAGEALSSRQKSGKRRRFDE